MFSSMVRSSQVPAIGSWKTRATRVARAQTGWRVTSVSSIRMLPLSTRRSPETALRKVDLPAPLVPITVTNWPVGISSDNPCRARVSMGVPGLKVILRSLALSMSGTPAARQALFAQGDDQGHGDQQGGDQVEVLGLQADEVAFQRQRNEETVDDGAQDNRQGQDKQLARGQNAFADNDRSQTDNDGTNTHGNIGTALGLGKQCAGQTDQTIGNRHAENDHGTGVDALRTRHARVGAGGADGQALLGGKVGVQRQLGQYHHRHHDQRAAYVVGQPVGLQDGEDGRFADDGNVGAAHDAQVDGVERNHHQDAGQQVHDFQAHVEQGGDDAGGGSGQCGQRGGQKGVHAAGDAYGTDGTAQRKAAIDGEVGEAQQAKGNENTQGDQTEDQADLKRAEKRKPGHAD